MCAALTVYRCLGYRHVLWSFNASGGGATKPHHHCVALVRSVKFACARLFSRADAAPNFKRSSIAFWLRMLSRPRQYFEAISINNSSRFFGWMTASRHQTDLPAVCPGTVFSAIVNRYQPAVSIQLLAFTHNVMSVAWSSGYKPSRPIL